MKHNNNKDNDQNQQKIHMKRNMQCALIALLYTSHIYNFIFLCLYVKKRDRDQITIFYGE